MKRAESSNNQLEQTRPAQASEPRCSTGCSADLRSDRRMTPRNVAVLGAFLLTLGGYAGFRWYRLSHYARWWATVAMGDSKDTVASKMGTPDVVQTKPHWLWCNVPECESEYMYGHSMPPQWWVVGFDHAGRAVWTEELQSP
jgi:hypothetical protein